MTTFTSLTGSECPTEVAKLINALISGKTNVDLDNLSQVGQAIIDGKSSISLDNLSAAGQAILDAKIEAEALAAQNGYIKFKLNGISTPIIFAWTLVSSNTSITSNSIDTKSVQYPISFNNVLGVVATANTSTRSAVYYASNIAITGLSLVFKNLTSTNDTSRNAFVIIVGY